MNRSNQKRAGAGSPGDAGKRPSLATHAVVALVAAAAGFVAIYLTAGPSANVPADAEAGAASPPATAAAPSATLAPKSEPRSAQVAPPRGAQAALPTGPGTNPLSVGEMAMFVFRKPTPLPEFTFNDATGAARTLADWRGKVVLMNIWATWCAPCRKEMPDLEQLQKTLGGADFEVVAISLDRGSAEGPRKFLQETAPGLKLFHEPTARLANQLKVIGMPATLLIDGQGREVGRLVGPAKWHSEDALRLVRAAIGAEKPAD